MRVHVPVIAIALAGCAKTDSSDLLSTGIYAAISASARGDGVTHVNATLYVGSPANLNFVDLTGDDTLVASHGSQEIEMSETVVLNIVSHHASFNTDAEGDQFQVAFLRTVDRGAPNSIATLPAKFSIDPPVTTASRAAPLTITWSPIDSSAPMRWEARGDCIEAGSMTLPSDTGSYTFEANTLQKKMGDTVPDDCQLEITLTRARAGQLDPGYGKGGVIEGSQVRKVTLTTTP